jgi:hypothetical protein
VVRVRVCLRRQRPQSTNPTIEAYGGQQGWTRGGGWKARRMKVRMRRTARRRKMWWGHASHDHGGGGPLLFT